MDAVLDNFELVLRAFGYTIAAVPVAGVLSLVFGTLLVAMRVGPVGVLRRAAAAST